MADEAVALAPAACHVDDWTRMRSALWPDGPADAHRADAAALLHRPASYAAFVALRADRPVGFVECAVRTDCVNGCEFSPAGFIEGCPSIRPRAAAASAVAWSTWRPGGRASTDAANSPPTC